MKVTFSAPISITNYWLTAIPLFFFNLASRYAETIMATECIINLYIFGIAPPKYYHSLLGFIDP